MAMKYISQTYISFVLPSNPYVFAACTKFSSIKLQFKNYQCILALEGNIYPQDSDAKPWFIQPLQAWQTRKKSRQRYTNKKAIINTVREKAQASTWKSLTVFGTHISKSIQWTWVQYNLTWKVLWLSMMCITILFQT